MWKEQKMGSRKQTKWTGSEVTCSVGPTWTMGHELHAPVSSHDGYSPRNMWTHLLLCVYLKCVSIYFRAQIFSNCFQVVTDPVQISERQKIKLSDKNSCFISARILPNLQAFITLLLYLLMNSLLTLTYKNSLLTSGWWSHNGKYLPWI